MSTLPTLLRKNYIVPKKDATTKEKKIIEDSISIDYILHIISDMIPEVSSNRIKNIPRAYGDKVIVLKSDTGSGKSTVLPPKLYTTFFHRTKRNIMVTQPRILTAMDIPETIVPWNSELKMDINIGYSTGPFKRLPTEKGIIFSTVGVLTQELKLNTDEEFLKKYQFIIVDEVHERSIDVDECLYLLKKFLKSNYSNPFCPLVILMSATFDEKLFIDYFEVPDKNYIQVIGSTFPIEMDFPKYSISNYIEYAALKAQELHIKNISDLDSVVGRPLKDGPGNEFRDILIFVKDSTIGKKICDILHLFNSNILTGDLDKMARYSDELKSAIKTKFKTGGNKNGENGENGENDENKNNKYVLPILLDSQTFTKGGLEYQNLFSSLDIIQVPLWHVNEETKTINFEEPPYEYVTPSRRIIVATNLAETGVTIPTLKYCIDTGYHLSSEYFPEYGCDALIAKNVALGSAIQRRGRVGRKAPGFFYPCYTEKTFKALPVEKIADILTNDVTSILLSILIREKNTDIIHEESINRIKNNQSENIFQTNINFSENWYTVNNELETNIASLDFIELPSIQALSYSVEKLHILGFMDDNYDITATGFYANKIRFIGLELSKFIMSGYFYKANVLDLITIAAFTYINKRNIFEKDFILGDFIKVIGSPQEIKSTRLKLKEKDVAFIHCDFTICILIWNAIQTFIDLNSHKESDNALETMEEWCKQRKLKFTGITKMIGMRDTIIENFLEIGMNPYYNGLYIKSYNLTNILSNNPNEGMEEIKKIKQCLYEGFKCNTLVHTNLTIYKSIFKNVPVKLKSAIIKDFASQEQQNPQQEQVQIYPKYVICNAYSISGKFGSAQYEFVSSMVSVLDGFVVPDLTFYLQ